ncbi:MAG: hypothetical protein QOI80_2068, partial [Solirubrobacteraceae bacterium]|nr:hypothetical protein [Solirubrobacteraceae bacterium]
FRRHAAALDRAGRSPLYVELMRGAADDGLVAQLFADDPKPPGSVPPLRLLAPLHELVLAGRAPELAAFYPSAGGTRPPAGAWSAARTALAEHADWLRARLPRTVQTNEPGRSTALYAGLQWLALRDPRPIRLLEIGASAGLNLIADRYAYESGGRTFGDPASPVRFVEPWSYALDASPRIAARRGCDLHPKDPREAADRLTLLSYAWPDELERFARLAAALALAAEDPAPVDAETASTWLARHLSESSPDHLTVVWHSVMRQYVPAPEWIGVERALAGTQVLAMEPGADHAAGFRLTAGGHLLATCGDHGPPVVWQTEA